MYQRWDSATGGLHSPTLGRSSGTRARQDSRDKEAAAPPSVASVHPTQVRPAWREGRSDWRADYCAAVSATEAVGLAFAAIAAAASLRTVQLMIQLHREAELRRLRDALIGLREVARTIHELQQRQLIRAELDDQFRDARAELERALILTPVDPSLQRLFDSLLEAEPGVQPFITATNAQTALSRLTSDRLPSPSGCPRASSAACLAYASRSDRTSATSRRPSARSSKSLLATHFSWTHGRA